MIVLDHMKLVKRDPLEVKKLRDMLLNAQVGNIQEVTTLHEDDGSCCKKESWNTTMTTISEAVNHPTKIISFNMNDPQSKDD